MSYTCFVLFTVVGKCLLQTPWTKSVWEVFQSAQIRKYFAHWNLILALLQHVKFNSKISLTFCLEAEAERFWAFRIALLRIFWSKTVLCSYFDTIYTHCNNSQFVITLQFCYFILKIYMLTKTTIWSVRNFVRFQGTLVGNCLVW